MNTLKVNLKNCYGIKKLEEDFDFSQCNTFSIYAPNGVMKTSFAKTFKDLSDDVPSKDLIFPNRETTREIKKENDNDISSNQVFVVEPYNENFNSEKMSTLLVNKELKSKYDEIHIKIDEEKERKERKERENIDEVIKQITPEKVNIIREQLMKVGYDPYTKPSTQKRETPSSYVPEGNGVDIFSLEGQTQENNKEEYRSLSSM